MRELTKVGASFMRLLELAYGCAQPVCAAMVDLQCSGGEVQCSGGEVQCSGGEVQGVVT